ncbi:protein EVI2B [Pogona vitticeps]
METHPALLLVLWAQLPRNIISAETKGLPASTPPPAKLPITRADIRTQPWTPPPSESDDSAKNNRELFTTEPSHPRTEAPASHDGHLIAAVIIGVTLIVMIVVIVGIFLWRRWKRAASPLPHWAGRSPFADGDLPDVSAEKESGQGPKRVSVLSLLPWKLNKDTELLENAEGPSSASEQNLELPPGPPGSQETESCPTMTGNSDSSASMQTTLSEEPIGLVEVPLQPDAPGPLDPPPPPNGLGEIHGDLCPNPSESLLPQPITDAQCPVPLDPSYQTPEEALPPPPEDLLFN